MPLLAREDVSLPTRDVLSWMFDEPSYDENKPILIDAVHPSRSISRRKARTSIRRIAAGLRNAGLKPGDCVCMHTHSDINYPVACLGVVAAGGIYAGTNPGYTTLELEHYIRIAQIRFWIVAPGMIANVREALKHAGVSNAVIIAFDVDGDDGFQETPDVSSWWSLQEHGEANWDRFDDLERATNTSVVRLFSSGTTGLPKAMDLSHYNCTSQHTVVLEHRPRPYEMRRLICNPLFLVGQVARVNTSAFRSGIPTYIMKRFDPDTWLANIEKYQITELSIVPAMVISLLQSKLMKRYSLASLRSIVCGSAPLANDLQREFKACLDRDTVFNLTWGMSETSCHGMLFDYPEQDLTGAVGRPLPGHAVKLVDDEGNESHLEGPGELCMRGPSMFSGYFDGSRLIKNDFDEEGYFHTGDLARRDNRTGLWYIVGRKKDLIKVRGWQVSPAEIENTLFTHPGVADAAVVGLRASDGSELPFAYIVVRAGATVTAGDIQMHVAQRLAKYKWLEAGVSFVESLPRNVNAKVQKNVLRDWARQRKDAGKL